MSLSIYSGFQRTRLRARTRGLLEAMISLSIACVAFNLPQAHAQNDNTTNDRTTHVRSAFKIKDYTFDVTTPPGYSLELLNASMQGPRVMHFHNERLFVGSQSGTVYWLDPPYQQATVLVTLDDYPHSVVVRDDIIYIATTSAIFSAPYSSNTQSLTEDELSQVVKLPGGRGHNSRTLKIGPDKRLYVSLGIRFNCNDEFLDASYAFDKRRGGLFVIDESDGESRLQPYSSGLRNPVGFDWHPVTNTLYASNNGPDHAGYDNPQEIFARVTEGAFHGMPWYQVKGTHVVRDECIASAPPRKASDVSLPVARFEARSAPMDVAFFNTDANSPGLHNNAVVAIHGSWATANGQGDGDAATRRIPKLVVVNFNGTSGDGATSLDVTDLLTGFQLPDGARWARPMGVAQGPDGDLYFTSDAALQGLYRLSYKN